MTLEFLQPRQPVVAEEMVVSQPDKNDIHLEKMIELSSRLEKLDIPKIVDKVYRELERKIHFDQRRRGL